MKSKPNGYVIHETSRIVVIATGFKTKTPNIKKNMTLETLCKNSNIPESLIRAVVSQLGGWEAFKESAPDITAHGIDGGFHGLIYHTETEKFAKTNIESIGELISEQAQELGYDSTFAMIRAFRCFSGETLLDVELFRAITGKTARHFEVNILNGLAWYAAEEVARAYCDAAECNQDNLQGTK